MENQFQQFQKEPKIPEVAFDYLLSSSVYIIAFANRVQTGNKVLKSLAVRTCGKDKETLLASYKAIGRPALNYAAPLWSLGTSRTKLQTCLLMSPQRHLHDEVQMLPGGALAMARQKASIPTYTDSICEWRFGNTTTRRARDRASSASDNISATSLCLLQQVKLVREQIRCRCARVSGMRRDTPRLETSLRTPTKPHSTNVAAPLD
ncbi:uncharacterized protein LOC118744778 [Rhagoletis pomonella]|uniref:uncharacterized protein LOC118744778 n=1 Tax=Rhagoletis pomonella TaxID=28610 RepID=UPI00177D8D8C|nr:uncharacterized protein LOC118744778 [Rhagoletis pomonella]